MVGLKRVGALPLIDLEVLCDLRGRESIPHPFAHLHPSPFADLDEYVKYGSEVPERLEFGDLGPLHHWFTTYLEADLRVECVVSIVGAARERILAHRSGDSGYVAVQRAEERAVEVFETSPFDLGAAVTGLVGLTKPGGHPRIVIPEFRRSPEVNPEQDEAVITVRQARTVAPAALSVPRIRVLRYCRVQSRWQPSRNWGFDRDKNMAVWLHVAEDGDYLYSPNFDYLAPVHGPMLRDRIDQLITEDVTALRRVRHG